MISAGTKRWLARASRPLRTALSRKGLARMTRRMRQGLAGRPLSSIALPLAVNSEATRLAELDARLGRLQLAWDQLIPSLLDSVSIAVAEARGAGRVHERINGVREDLDRLAARLDLNLIDVKRQLTHGPSQAPRNSTDCTIVSVGAVAASILDGPQLMFSQRDEPVLNTLMVGRYPTRGTDIVAPTATGLPFGPGSIRSIVVDPGFDLGQTWADVEALLGDWLGLLVPGGLLFIERIDLAGLLEAATDHTGSASASSLSEAVAAVALVNEAQWVASLSRLGFADLVYKRSQRDFRISIQAKRADRLN